MKCDKDGELDSVEHERDAALEKLRKDYEDRLREHEEEHSAKIKQLAKDLNRQLMEKEREFEETLNEAIERVQRGESDLLQEHQAEIKDLRKDLGNGTNAGAAAVKSTRLRWRPDVDRNKYSLKEELSSANSATKWNSHALGMDGGGVEAGLEMAELQSQLELSRDTVQPLVSAPAPVPRTFDPDDPNLVSELQNMELHNMDLQAQLRHVNAELAHSKLREKDSQQRIEVLEHRIRHRKDDDTPPLSPDGSLLSHEDSALLREPTELEYLKNILYEYMMGKETQGDGSAS
nr:hypothetical protein BaRGS_029165 [Batillaria attramentaria]